MVVTPETLETAGVRIADAVAAVTGKDETNLVTSMLAKMEFAAPRVVARVNDPANAWMFTPANGVDVGVNQAEITGRFVLEGINVHDVYTLMKLGRDEHRIVQATVGAQRAWRAWRSRTSPSLPRRSLSPSITKATSPCPTARPSCSRVMKR